MPTNTLPPTPYELDANVVALEFPDNFLLIDLCGEHDRNLAASKNHVMIDGASGVGLMGMLFDKNKADSTKPIPKPKPFEPEPLPEELSLLLKKDINLKNFSQVI